MNTVNLELYRIFLAVVQESSFTAAARRLFISQPAVSQSIQQLEKQLGAILFIRSVKGVRLSKEGEVLFRHVDAALALLESGEQKLDKMRHLQLGELRVGAGDTPTRHFLLPLLKRFTQQYPEISLSVRNGTTNELANYLRQGKIDLAFVSLPFDGGDMELHPCLNIHDIFVAGRRFEHLREGISPAQLSELPLIMLEKQANTRRIVDAALLEMGVQINVEIELGSHDLLLDFARNDLGVSCVVREFSRLELDLGDLFEIPLHPPLPTRTVAAAHLRDIPLPVPAKSLLEMLPVVTP